MEAKDVPYHLYLGCEVFVYNLHSKGILHSIDRLGKCVIDFHDNGRTVLIHEVKLILRRLSSMTEEEKHELMKIRLLEEDYNYLVTTMGRFKIYTDAILPLTQYSPEEFIWYLQNRFWLFDQSYFEKGIIIEKK